MGGNAAKKCTFGGNAVIRRRKGKVRGRARKFIFAKNFPDATSVETALYQADGSILITLTTDDTLGKRTYTQDDKQYVSLFERHQFGEQTEKTHWIALRGDVVIGEGWGSEL